MGGETTAWDADRVRAQSSQQVLLQWIATEVNCERWSSGVETKDALCSEINALLHAQGIDHRTNADIRGKIWELEMSMASAMEVLAENGCPGLETLRDCAEERVKAAVLRCCPHFELLAPVIIAPRNRRNSLRRSRMSSKRDKDASSSSTDLIPLETASEQQQLEHEREKNKIELEALREKKRLELETARKQAEARHQVELSSMREKAKASRDIELVVERAMARQKLLSAGISKDDVDRMLPEILMSV